MRQSSVHFSGLVLNTEESNTASLNASTTFMIKVFHIVFRSFNKKVEFYRLT